MQILNTLLSSKATMKISSRDKKGSKASSLGMSVKDKAKMKVLTDALANISLANIDYQSSFTAFLRIENRKPTFKELRSYQNKIEGFAKHTMTVLNEINTLKSRYRIKESQVFFLKS